MRARPLVVMVAAVVSCSFVALCLASLLLPGKAMRPGLSAMVGGVGATSQGLRQVVRDAGPPPVPPDTTRPAFLTTEATCGAVGATQGGAVTTSEPCKFKYRYGIGSSLKNVAFGSYTLYSDCPTFETHFNFQTGTAHPASWVWAFNLVAMDTAGNFSSPIASGNFVFGPTGECP